MARRAAVARLHALPHMPSRRRTPLSRARAVALAAEHVVRTNPYQLLTLFPSVGFKALDRLARYIDACGSISGASHALPPLLRSPPVELRMRCRRCAEVPLSSCARESGAALAIFTSRTDSTNRRYGTKHWKGSPTRKI